MCIIFINGFSMDLIYLHHKNPKSHNRVMTCFNNTQHSQKNINTLEAADVA